MDSSIVTLIVFMTINLILCVIKVGLQGVKSSYVFLQREIYSRQDFVICDCKLQIIGQILECTRAIYFPSICLFAYPNQRCMNQITIWPTCAINTTITVYFPNVILYRNVKVYEKKNGNLFSITMLSLLIMFAGC